MDINNPPNQVNFLRCDTGENIRCKIIPLPAWNMDTNNSSSFNHNLGTLWKNIIDCQLVIKNDADNGRWTGAGFGDAVDPNLSSMGIQGIDSNQVYAYRRTGGQFDAAAFSGGGSRGICVLWYWV